LGARFQGFIIVQRQWVYLEGIFSSINQEIKDILPVETARFASIDSEFSSMLRKVYKSPLVLDVVNITNIQTVMERLSSQLTNIQKSLGDYLEKERSKFPRFYFIGDEDLLEILGNGRNLKRIIPHFKKLFGFSNVLIKDNQILCIISMEGETVIKSF
jgi:dynein heavy chain 1